MYFFTLTSDPPMLRQTTWHVDPDGESDSEAEHLTRPADSSSNAEGFQLVANASKRVWEELYVCKKPVSLMNSEGGGAL